MVVSPWRIPVLLRPESGWPHRVQWQGELCEEMIKKCQNETNHLESEWNRMKQTDVIHVLVALQIYTQPSVGPLAQILEDGQPPASHSTKSFARFE